VNRKLVLISAIILLIGLAPSFAGAFPEYYDISDQATAQAEARQRSLPLAWLGSFPECLTVGAPEVGSINDLTQMAMRTLQGNAVVIFFDGRNMAPVPALIHAQYHIQDDGPLPNGAAWTSPKVVFSNPEVTTILGRVSYTQMKEDRDIPINSALQMIRNDPTALQPPQIIAPVGTPDRSDSDMLGTIISVASWIYAVNCYLAAGLALGIVALCFLFVRYRRR